MSDREHRWDAYEPYLTTLRIIEPEDQCPECAGSGYRVYASTATWRGGIGGQAMTEDVCDQCWGSGNRHRPWPSHRLLESKP